MDFVHYLLFKETRCSGSQLYFHHQTKQHLTWWTLEIKLFSLIRDHTVNFLRYTPENTSSTGVVTGKWLFEIKN